MNCTTVQLKEILAKHAEWFADNSKGVRANLSEANLRGADLSEANLRGADLSCADLRGANLRGANLSSANLSWASLNSANLSHANLNSADLIGADLRGADMDYSSGIPLWCGGSKFKCEVKLIQQVCAHLVTLECDDAEWLELREKILSFAKKSHRAFDLVLAKQKKG